MYGIITISAKENVAHDVKHCVVWLRDSFLLPIVEALDLHRKLVDGKSKIVETEFKTVKDIEQGMPSTYQLVFREQEFCLTPYLYAGGPFEYTS